MLLGVFQSCVFVLVSVSLWSLEHSNMHACPGIDECICLGFYERGLISSKSSMRRTLLSLILPRSMLSRANQCDNSLHNLKSYCLDEIRPCKEM